MCSQNNNNYNNKTSRVKCKPIRHSDSKQKYTERVVCFYSHWIYRRYCVPFNVFRSLIKINFFTLYLFIRLCALKLKYTRVIQESRFFQFFQYVSCYWFSAFRVFRFISGELSKSEITRFSRTVFAVSWSSRVYRRVSVVRRAYTSIKCSRNIDRTGLSRQPSNRLSSLCYAAKNRPRRTHEQMAGGGAGNDFIAHFVFYRHGCTDYHPSTT